jgi:hypothetical protein
MNSAAIDPTSKAYIDGEREAAFWKLDVEFEMGNYTTAQRAAFEAEIVQAYPYEDGIAWR